MKIPCIKAILCFILFSIQFSLVAQESALQLKWGKISPTEKNLKVIEGEDEAPAVVLGEEATISFNLADEVPTIVIYKHYRIKILNQEGLEYANIQIPYHSASGHEEITGVKAQTISEDGTVSKVTKKDIFYNETNKYWSEVKFAMPNVGVGSIIEYKYKLEISGLGSIPTWFFQSNIPKLFSTLEIDMPRMLKYRPFIRYATDLKEDTYNYFGNMLLPKYERRKVGIDGYETVRQGTTSVKTEMNRYSYSMENIPSFKGTSSVYRPRDYYSKIYFNLIATEFRQGVVQPTMNTWDKYVEVRTKDPTFGKQYTSKSNYKKILKAAEGKINPKQSFDEKLHAICSFVSSNVKWDEYYSTYSEKSLNKVFENGTGSSCEINLMAVALMREYGIKSYPVFVSTKKHGKVEWDSPFSGQFNHVIALVENGESEQFLDLTKGMLPDQLVTIDALNDKGLIIKDDNKFLVKDIEVPVSKSIQIIDANINEEGTLDGNCKLVSSHYENMYQRYIFDEKTSDVDYAARFFDEDYSLSAINNLSAEKDNDINKDMKSDFNFEIEEFITADDDIIYIPLTINDNLDFLDGAFDEINRTYPLEIPYPFEEKFVMKLKVPDGYVVEELPQNLKVSMPAGFAKFMFRVSESNGNIQISHSFMMKKHKYEPTEYVTLRSVYQQATEKLSEMIILKKKE